MVYVATEHDSVYAFDADNNTGLNGAPLWHRSFIDPTRGITSVSSGDVGCGDLVPEIGITSTPVIDPATSTIFLVAKMKDNGKYFQRLHALDITTGTERSGSPVVIHAQVDKGRREVSADSSASIHNARRSAPACFWRTAALYIAWASHCDITPYHGWVMDYDETTLSRPQSGTPLPMVGWEAYGKPAPVWPPT